jgi:hypothetical protein
MAKTTHRRTGRPDDAARQADARDPLPTWRNTRPRGNPETHTQDLKRSRERFEAVLGR